uniref:Uncharacterized protein n=1 Tax=Cacopsylla melanoneura TaxID=428564 RepID=A0A8D9B251_9HEMI
MPETRFIIVRRTITRVVVLKPPPAWTPPSGLTSPNVSRTLPLLPRTQHVPPQVSQSPPLSPRTSLRRLAVGHQAHLWWEIFGPSARMQRIWRPLLPPLPLLCLNHRPLVSPPKRS